jgi:hypothetical protein
MIQSIFRTAPEAFYNHQRLIMELESRSRPITADGTEVLLSPFEQAQEIFCSALRNLTENNISSQKSEHCNRFQGIAFNLKSDEEMKELNQCFVNICSYLDKRRWSTKNAYSGKGFKAYRGECCLKFCHNNIKHSIV